MISDEMPKGSVVAHELGHVLALGHGNGLDDDADGLIDEFCDRDEDRFAGPLNIMNPHDDTVEALTPAQVATARAAAFVTTGATRQRPLPTCPPVCLRPPLLVSP